MLEVNAYDKTTGEIFPYYTIYGLYNKRGEETIP